MRSTVKAKNKNLSTAVLFNADNRIGTRVRYWPGVRQGPGVESRTRSVAQLLASGEPVVWVEGHAACIALSHVEVI